MLSTNPKATILALFFGLLMFSNQLLANVKNVNVLIIGCSRDSGEMHPSNVSWSAQKAPTARNLPARSFWARIHKEYPALSPMRDKAKGKGDFAI